MNKAKLQANNRHLAAHYEQVSVRSRKEERIRERIEIAAKRKGTTSRNYILTVLRAALEADGVTVDTHE